MVDEQLAGHEEEGEVVEAPGEGEEARVVVEAVTKIWSSALWRVDRWVSQSGRTNKAGRAMGEEEKVLTILNRLNPSPPRQLIRSQHSNKHAQSEHADPPSCDVSDRVDLHLEVVLGPERDARQVKRPVDRVGRVRVRGGEAGVVLEHENLEFKEPLEEVHLDDLFGLGSGGAVEEVGGVCGGEDGKP